MYELAASVGGNSSQLSLLFTYFTTIANFNTNLGQSARVALRQGGRERGENQAENLKPT